MHQKMLQMIVNTTPSAIFVVDNRCQTISSYYSSSKKKCVSKRIIGKKILRIAANIFDDNTCTLLVEFYQKALQSNESIELPKIKHVTAQGLPEYFSCQLTYIPEKNYVLIYMRNITEETLIEEEFLCMSEEYETVTQELNSALSNLDFHLMDIEQAQKKISTLYRLTSIVQKTVKKQEVLNAILDGITREFGFSNMAILLLDEERKELTVDAYRGYLRNIEKNRPISVGSNHSISQAVLTRQLVYVDDIQTINKEYSKVSEVAIPLIFDDKVLGVLSVETTDERTLQPYDLDLFRSLAGQMAMTIAHARYVEKVEKEAVTDGLTGLYNHRYFRFVLQQEFKRAVRYNRPLSMLMIDIDYFKHYNDTNGHPMGDRVLHSVANLIKNHCRDVDYVVRYGGEEFAVILPETNVEEAYHLAERIRQSISQYPFHNRQMQPNGEVTVSIGVSGYPIPASNHDELVDFADMALYAVKKDKRNSVHIYR